MCCHTPCSSITVVLSAVSHLVSRSLCLLVIGAQVLLGHGLSSGAVSCVLPHFMFFNNRCFIGSQSLGQSVTMSVSHWGTGLIWARFV